MAPHEEFLELSASATAGELTSAEQVKLDAHLAVCPECRQALSEYELASQHAMAALASEVAPTIQESDGSWSVAKAEKAFFERLESEQKPAKSVVEEDHNTADRGQRFTYRPSLIRWREVWMPFAATVVIAVALGVVAYRTRLKHESSVSQTTAKAPKAPTAALEEQLSDAGHERTQLLAKLAEEDKLIADLRRQLTEQQKTVGALQAAVPAVSGSSNAGQVSRDPRTHPDEEIAAAQAKLQELQKTIDTMTGQREEWMSRATTLEAKVDELTRVAREREETLDQRGAEVSKQRELLERDRDIRELMGARDLYIAEVHDVSGKGTDKTYGRIFYTRGKRLVFYAYDLDVQPGIRNASTFQAWGRRGPDKQQALNLGIFYEDNVGKKRWVLKASDPKSLEDIDAVFVTVEPNGGSQRPSGKQLLFAYLRVSPNHP